MQHQELSREFIALPASLIQYIVSFIVPAHPTSGYDAILNTFKAFAGVNGNEEEEKTDPLQDYKKNVQRYLADFVYAGVLPELKQWHSAKVEELCFTDQEIMNFYDLIFCNTDTLLYGADADEETIQKVDTEFNDCNYYTATIYDNYDGALEILSALPVIRLLEVALLQPEGEMLKYLLECNFYHPAMLIYIYIKYNHQLYGSGYGSRSLAANATLLRLLMKNEDPDLRVRLLEAGVDGRRLLCAKTDAELANVVLPNLKLVKAILPEYRMIC